MVMFEETQSSDFRLAVTTTLIEMSHVDGFGSGRLLKYSFCLASREQGNFHICLTKFASGMLRWAHWQDESSPIIVEFLNAFKAILFWGIHMDFCLSCWKCARITNHDCTVGKDLCMQETFSFAIGTTFSQMPHDPNWFTLSVISQTVDPSEFSLLIFRRCQIARKCRFNILHHVAVDLCFGFRLGGNTNMASDFKKTCKNSQSYCCPPMVDLYAKRLPHWGSNQSWTWRTRLIVMNPTGLGDKAEFLCEYSDTSMNIFD